MSDSVAQEGDGAEMEVTSPAQQAPRSPLKEVQILLPVWGYRFVRQFLDFMLPTLLAPGNIPAVAEMLPCRFVLMSSMLDVPTIRAHPAWRQLARICNVEIQSIDDLITDGNHTATITLAYARALRERGDAMLDTCFIFLVSDYLVADGSLQTVVKRVQAGASGVLAGNFQIIAEEAIPLLRRRIDPASPYIRLPPRELVTWALAHLHPATTANIVNFKLSHNVHTNRLFWRVDQNTLIGRFYLMHMIGIRPEVTDFVVGSSCDYSFIPEMCPSNNVETLTDSDDYLVVELQPRHHEHRNLRWGPIETRDFANSLSEWTTARHRENIRETVIFHAEDIPPTVDGVVAEANAFIDKVTPLLSPQPQPHRHHHYWIGSIAAHRAMTRRAISKEDWKFLLGEPPDQRGGLTGLLWRLRFAIFGQPPDVSRWHPRWPDYRLPLEALQKLTPADGQLLVVADEPRGFGHWLVRFAKNVYSLEAERLLELSRRDYLPMVGSFDTCLLFLREGFLDRVDEFIERTGPLLKPGGFLMIVATNDRPLGEATGFSMHFAQHAGGFGNLATWVTDIHYVRSTWLRWQIQSRFAQIGTAKFRRIVFVPLTVGLGGLLAVASYLCNRFTAKTESIPPADGLCSSVFMIMRPSAGSSGPPLPRFKIDRELLLMRTPTRELQYDRCLELRDEVGLEPLGLVTNQIWHDDPGQLPFILARYSFVAKLLAERHDVGELGCADAFGTRIVLQDVKKITVYDSNPIFIDDVRRRSSEEWPLETHVHDILQGPLPKPHDSIYSLGVMERISPDDEDKFIRHLSDSLSRNHDILIIGSSSFEEAKTLAQKRNRASADALAVSNTGGSAASSGATGAASGRAGLVKMPYEQSGYGAGYGYGANDQPGRRYYPRTGAGMKALLERYFHSVFMFSMVDEVVQVGANPSAQYLFALCCGKKTGSKTEEIVGASGAT